MKLGNLFGQDGLSEKIDLDVSKIRVEDYQLVTTKNKPIRKATKVIFPDGEEISFLDKMSKKDALSNGIYQYFIKKGYPRDEATRLSMEVW